MLIPVPPYKDGQDIVFRMSFHATNHPVQMHNRIWVSTRALELEGINAKDYESLKTWLNTVYQKFFTCRTLSVPNPTDIKEENLKTLMQSYCANLKATTAIQDYWVVIMYNQFKLDSRQMKL